MKLNRALAWLACLTSLMSLSTFAAETTAVVKDGRINVRGQPSLVGEVITQLQKGEKVVVLEEITLDKPKTNEPAKWLRVRMPANTPVWIYGPFVDPASKSVKVSRINLRAGPGENYSVVGRLERGATFKEIRRVEDWMEIETPEGAYAFVAANLVTPSNSSGTPLNPAPTQPNAPVAQPNLAATRPNAVATPLKQEPMKQAAVPTPLPASELAKSNPVQPIRPERTADAPAPLPSPLITRQTELSTTVKAAPNVPPTLSTTAPTTQPTISAPPVVPVPIPRDTPALTVIKPKSDESLQQRVVRREGLVRSTVSIQAPTYFELLNPDNRKTINYLHADQLDLNLKDYRGRRVVVTGEEAIDPRWPKTPLIEVVTLELIP